MQRSLPSHSVTDRYGNGRQRVCLSSDCLSGNMSADTLVGKMHQMTRCSDLWAQRPKVKLKKKIQCVSRPVSDFRRHRPSSSLRSFSGLPVRHLHTSTGFLQLEERGGGRGAWRGRHGAVEPLGDLGRERIVGQLHQDTPPQLLTHRGPQSIALPSLPSAKGDGHGGTSFSPN